MRNLPQPLCEVARVMGASRMYVVRKVVLPSPLPGFRMPTGQAADGAGELEDAESL